MVRRGYRSHRWSALRLCCWVRYFDFTSVCSANHRLPKMCVNKCCAYALASVMGACSSLIGTLRSLHRTGVYPSAYTCCSSRFCDYKRPVLLYQSWFALIHRSAASRTNGSFFCEPLQCTDIRETVCCRGTHCCIHKITSIEYFTSLRCYLKSSMLQDAGLASVNTCSRLSVDFVNNSFFFLSDLVKPA